MARDKNKRSLAEERVYNIDDADGATEDLVKEAEELAARDSGVKKGINLTTSEFSGDTGSEALLNKGMEVPSFAEGSECFSP